MMFDLEFILAFSHQLLSSRLSCETHMFTFRNSFSHMTQEDFVRQLHEQGMSPVTIHKNVVEVFGSL
jgi:hypothetical protein